MAKTSPPTEPSAAELSPTLPGILQRFRSMFSGGNRAAASESPDWPKLAKLCESGNEDAVLDWCLTNGFTPITAQLASIAISERARLIPLFEQGERANLRLGPAQAELTALARCSVSSLAAATELTRRLAELQAEIAVLTNDSALAYQAAAEAKHINEQFGELFGMAPARVCNGSASPTMFEAFISAGLDPYRLYSWKLTFEAMSISTEPKPRNRISAH